jgi:hypothetical protein
MMTGRRQKLPVRLIQIGVALGLIGVVLFVIDILIRG